MNRNTIIGLAFIAVLIISKWLVVPFITGVNENRSQIEQLTFTNQKWSQLPERSKAAEQFLATSRVLSQKLEAKSYVGSNPALISSSILSDLKRLANDAGIDIRNQSLGEFKPGVINILPVSLFADGDIEGMAKFFSLLDSDKEKLYLIESATVGKSKKGNSLRTNIKLFVMVSKDE